jgi:hypothetical protein
MISNNKPDSSTSATLKEVDCELARAHLRPGCDIKLTLFHKCAEKVSDRSNGLWRYHSNAEAALINAVVGKHPIILLRRDFNVDWNFVNDRLFKEGYKRIVEKVERQLPFQSRWGTIKVSGEYNTATIYYYFIIKIPIIIMFIVLFCFVRMLIGKKLMN